MLNKIQKQMLDDKFLQEIGETSNLQTQNKGSLVEAVNETVTQLAHEAQRLNRIRDLKFDIYPTYYATLEASHASIMQSFVLLENDEFLMSQAEVDNYPVNGEHFTINRLSTNGVLLDKMEIVYGGHGVNFQAFIENDEIYIYYACGVDNDYKIIKFKYLPNGSINLKLDNTYETLPKIGNGYQHLAIDKHNDLIAITTRGEDYWNRVDIYSFNQYINGNQTIPTKTLIGMGSFGTLQGMAVFGENLFWWVGSPNQPDSIKLYVYKWENGNYEEYTYPKLAQNETSTLTTEPEGIFVYRDNESGDISVLVGICSRGLRWVRKIYGFHSHENGLRFNSSTLDKTQTFKIFESDGRSKTPSTLPSKLSDLTEAGEYYFTTQEWLSFTDIPDRYKSSGWWVRVYPKARDGSIRQEAIRNTSTNTQWKIGRTIAGNGTIYNWIPLKSEHTIIWQGDSRGDFSTSFTLNESLNNFDYVTIKIRSDAGQNAMERTIHMPTWDNNSVVFETHNIPDSTSTVRVDIFEYRVSFSSNRDSFTNVAAVQIAVSSGNVTRTDNISSIGIQAIIGVRL